MHNILNRGLRLIWGALLLVSVNLAWRGSDINRTLLILVGVGGGMLVLDAFCSRE